MALTPSRIFYLYGTALLLGGLISFALAGFAPKAKSAIMMGGGCAVLMYLIGYLGQTKPIAITIGRFLTLIFGCVFGWRGYLIRNVEEKQYLFVAFMLLVFASAVTLLLQAITARSTPKVAKKQY